MDETSVGLATSACAPSGDQFCRLEFAPRESIDLGAEMGAERAQTTRHRDLRNALLAALLLSAWRDPARWLVYSRDRNNYKVYRRYLSPIISYDRMIWATQSLENASLIDHRRTRPSPSARFRSTFRATKKLLLSSPITSVDQLEPLNTELVRLKNLEKQLQTYTDTDYIRQLRIDIEEQNLALGKAAISFSSNEWHTDAYGLLRSETRTINPARFKLYRVFNTDWRHGGRWYGAWWQNINSNERSLIRIDGEPVHEIDFDHLHPTLLAAVIGQELASTDPYIIDGYPRNHCKKALNILLNANTEKSAVLALQSHFAASQIERPGRYAQAVVEAVKAQHPNFANLWGTGLGLQLQFIDSCICARIQKHMREQSIPVLSIHDSFLVPTSRGGVLKQTMEEMLALTKYQLAKDGLTNFSALGMHALQENLTSGAGAATVVGLLEVGA